MEKISYLGLPNCYRLSNGTVEVVVTTDVGPRIIRYGFVGEENMFGEFPDLVTPTELGDWKALGGHRLWAAPEANPRTYAPDNNPIDFLEEGNLGIRLMQPADAAGIQKEIRVTLDPQGTNVTVEHTITNRNLWPIDTAPWALTIFRNGVCILPQEPYRSHDDYLLPARPLVLWYFTDLTDPRLTLGKKYICLRPDEQVEEAQKIGITNKQGWSAYHRDRTLFLKRFPYQDGATYPDYGSNNETFTSLSFLEIESLGAMVRLEPGASAEHVERWYLFRNVEIGADAASLDAAIAPLVARTE